MTNKKDLFIAILATFCLTATLFLAIPTRSQTGHDPSSVYDPMMDLNHDGTIDIYDAIVFAGHFGTSGDPTVNVNVTNPRFQVVEKDLSISVSGGNSTDVFPTEGYDRMFVSAAIIDVSNRTVDYTVNLAGVNWYWEMVDGVEMKTFTPADYNRGVSISIRNASYIPTSSWNSAEFPVETIKCSLSFWANSSLARGSEKCLVHVSVYLTVGTTSPPSVQNTYVTNMPYRQPEPAFGNQGQTFNVSITNGQGGDSGRFYLDGYSRMFVSLILTNASYQGVPVTTTVSLTSVYWEPYGGWQSVSTSILNATYDGIQLPIYSPQIPAEFDTRGSSCWIYFSISSGAISGWVEFDVNVYLRNE